MADAKTGSGGRGGAWGVVQAEGGAEILCVDYPRLYPAHKLIWLLFVCVQWQSQLFD